jgi:zinc/manganese transport system substrate-binding protein
VSHRHRHRIAVPLLGVVLAGLVAGCGSSVSLVRAGAGNIPAVGAENEYADVISQVGGRYVSVTAIESSPNADPHTYEASPSVAQAVSTAKLVVQNGVGYDTFMNRVEAAAPNTARRVIDAQTLLGLPDSTPNPHLWYAPRTMPAVAGAIAADLARIDPRHAAYFAANARRFDASLAPWYAALKRFAARYPHATVATTEPVADYMLQAAGTRDLTPFGLQADIMNGVDPAPQDVTVEKDLLAQHRVKAIVYNQQVTDTLTQSFLAAARADRIPVVGVYETMPMPGYDYQSWMLAEVRALERAVATGDSTTRLK